MKPKAPWPVTAGMIAIAVVVILIGLTEDRRSEARSAERAVHSAVVRSAAESSYGEEPKPEGHGR